MKLKLAVRTEVIYNLVEMTTWQGNSYDIEFLYKENITERGELVARERYSNINEAITRFKEVTEGMRK